MASRIYKYFYNGVDFTNYEHGCKFHQIKTQIAIIFYTAWVMTLAKGSHECWLSDSVIYPIHSHIICNSFRYVVQVQVGMSMGRIGSGGYFPDPRPAGESVPRPRPRSPPAPRGSPRNPTVFLPSKFKHCTVPFLVKIMKNS